MAPKEGGMHSRQLFFEAVFATKLFTDGIGVIKDRWEAAQKNMQAANDASAASYKATMDVVKAKAAETFQANTEKAQLNRDKAIQSFKETTAAYAIEMDKQIAATEAAYAKMAAERAAAAEQSTMLGGGQMELLGASGGVGLTAEESRAKEMEIANAQAVLDAKITARAKELEVAQATFLKETEAAGIMRDKEIAMTEEVAASKMSKMTQFTSTLSSMGNTAASLAMGLGVATGVIGGLYMAMDHIVLKYAQWAAETARLSSATGVDVEVMQELVLRGEEFNVTAQKMETFLTRFSRAVITNSQSFKAMGIDTTNTTTALMGLMNILSQTTDDAQKLVIVTSLMPGSAKNAVGDIVAMLSETSAEFQKQIDLGKQMGIILDKNSVSAGVLAKSFHDVMLQGLQGVENQLAQGMLPNMEAIWVVIGTGLTSAKGGIAGLGTAIASVVGSIIGFMSGLFGITIDWDKAMQNAITTIQQQATEQKNKNDIAAAGVKIQENEKQQVKDLTEANKDLNRIQQEKTRAENEGLKDLTKNIQAQTTEIDRQIKVLNDNATNFAAAEDAKVKAMQDEKQNYDDLLKLSDDLHTSELSRLQDALDASRDVTDRRMKQNETLVDYQRRMYQLDLTNAIAQEQNKRKTTADTTQQQIDLLTQQVAADKNNYKLQTDSQIDALTKQKDALNTYLKARSDSIQTQMQNEQDATQRMVDANTAKIEQLQTTSQQAAGDSAGAYTIDFKTMQTQVTAVLQQMKDSSVGTANDIGNAINSIFNGKGLTQQQQATLNNFGRSIGGAIWTGIEAGITGAAGSLLDKIIMPGMSGDAGATKQGIDAMLNDYHNHQTNWLNGISGNVGHADGGVFATPHMANIAEGSKPEAIIPLTNPTRAAQVMQQAGLTRPAAQGGNTTLIAQFNGPVADQLVASRVTDRLVVEAKRKNLIYGAGL